MKTNIELDDLLLEQALLLSKAKTKREVVNLALAHFVKKLQRDQLLTLRGKVEWDGDLDASRRL